jgi:hypothetical protein
MILDGEPPVNTGDALRHFIKIAAGAVLVFSFYSIPAALADQCTDTESCDDPAFPQCNFNPQRSEWKCTARGAVFCAAAAQSYTCAPGQQCNGDGSAPPYCR